MRTILICTALMACAACQKATSPAAAGETDIAASKQAIEAAENEQISAIGQKYLAGATGLYADDAVFIGGDGKMTSGKDAITADFKQFLADPAQKIDYTPGPKTFSSSGDMAYSTAAFTETFTDPRTKKPVTVTGTNLSVWRKQADGSWKLAADSNPGAPSDAKAE